MAVDTPRTVAPATDFDRDTAVEPTVDGWSVNLTDRWSIAGNPNGGYLLATVVRAMAAAAGRPDPLSVTAHYLSPATPGPAAIGVQVVKTGRTYSTLTASLRQGDRERFRVVGALGNLTSLSGPSLSTRATPPALPPVDECANLLTLRAPDGGPAPEIFNRFELRIDPRVGWPRGRRAGESEIAGWIRFADGRPPDVASLPLFADALPPAVLDLIPALWVPTVSFTVMVRAKPAPGWLRAVFRTRTVVGGTLEEDGEVWDSDGQLVCLSRQLAVVLPIDDAGGQGAP